MWSYQQGLAASFSSFDEVGQRLEAGVSNNILDEQIPQPPPSRFFHLQMRSFMWQTTEALWQTRMLIHQLRSHQPTEWEHMCQTGSHMFKPGQRSVTCIANGNGISPFALWLTFDCWSRSLLSWPPLSASSLRWCTTWPFWFSSCLISWRRIVKSPEWCGRVWFRTLGYMPPAVLQVLQWIHLIGFDALNAVMTP